MTNPADTIPTVGHHRGVPLHDCQPRERIEGIVKPEIDTVYDMEDPQQLFAWCGDPWRSPESRLFAAAKLNAFLDITAESRWSRPSGITRERVQAAVAMLNSQKWRDPTHYGGLCGWPRGPGMPEPPRRETPLPDHFIVLRSG